MTRYACRVDLVTASGWNDLRALGVTTVIDLRRPEERTHDVPDDVDLVSVDLDGDEREFWIPLEQDGRWGTPLYYSSHLAELARFGHTPDSAFASTYDSLDLDEWFVSGDIAPTTISAVRTWRGSTVPADLPAPADLG